MSLIKKLFRTAIFAISNLEDTILTGKAAGVVFSRPTIPECDVAILVIGTKGDKVKTKVFVNNGLEEYARIVSRDVIKRHYVEGRLDFV